MVTGPRGTQARRRSARSVWRNIHLGLALILGGLFAFLGVSGSLLVFHDEIDALLNSELLTRQSDAPRDLPIAGLVATVAAEIGPVRRIDLAVASDGVHRMQVASRDEPSELLEVTMDPASGERLGTRPWRRHLIAVVYDLHYSLLAGRIGRDLVGYSGLALLVSVGSGIYLWWPRHGGFAKALRVKRRAAGARRLYDIHKSVGLPTALLLCVLAFSGVSLQFPETTRAAAVWLLPASPPEADREAPDPSSTNGPTSTNGPSPINDPSSANGPALETALARARTLVPDGRVRRIVMPNAGSDSYRIHLRRPGEVRRSGGLNIVWVNAASGEVEATRLARDYSAADWFLAWQFPLHNGEAAGLTGRWIVFGLGFVPLALYVTGIGIWWKKRRARARRSTSGRALSPFLG